MTDVLDATEAPLSRTPAQFFFETGYFAAYAEACIAARNKPVFELTDAIVSRAWDIAGDAHSDRAEFDRYLCRADSADARLAEAEATYRAFDADNRDADGSREGLVQGAAAMRTCGADLFPADREGRVHFARVLMDSVASVIEAALARRPQHGKPISEACGIAMVEVLPEDRDELERGLITQGFPPDRAREIAQEQAANDGALQMLARHRMAVLASAPVVNNVEDRFWLIVREPGMVPRQKGPFRHPDKAKVLREFIAANPRAFIDYLTIDADGTPWVNHGPEVLQMTDGRSMSVGRKHNERVREAAEQALARPRAAVGDEPVAIIREMVRLADMTFEESVSEPEENGNYAVYERAKRFLALQSQPATVEGQ